MARRMFGAAVLCIAFVGAAPSQAADGYRACRGGADPGGTKHTGGFYRQIRARRVTCARAQRVTEDFAYWASDRIPGSNPPRVFYEVFKVASAAGRSWRCRAARTGTRYGNPRYRIGCKSRGGRRVKFIAAA